MDSIKVGAIRRDDSLLAVALVDDQVFELSLLLGVGRAAAPDPLGSYLRQGILNFLDLRKALESETLRDSARLSEPVEERDWALPFRPGKIVAVGRNYAAHARELGNEVPTTPVLFEKAPSTCIGPGETVRFDPAEGRADYEGEIAVVIGKTTRAVSEEAARNAVAGFTLLNDVTARDMQQRAKEKGLPWFEAKNRDTFCPLGPVVALTDGLPAPFEWEIETRVNGEVRQQGNTRDFIFSVERLIAHISKRIKLEPGDVISTGTPEGVGPFNEGDTLEVLSPRLGVLKNNVKYI